MRLLFLIFLPLLSLSQVVLTPLGLKDRVSGQNFVELDCPGKTSEELFIAGLNYTTRSTKNPRNVILGQQENESFRYESTINSLSQFSYFVVNYIVSCRYAVEISLKENKVRYEILLLDMEAKPVNKPHDPSPSKLLVSGDNMNDFSIYKQSSGKLLKPTVKNDLEKYINAEIRDLTAYLRSATLIKEE